METYSYDSQNRLIGWADGVSAISYAHDALDRRIAVTLDGVTESFVYDPWSPYSSIANDVLLDFEDGALVRRWLHGPEVDEPLAYERYAGTTAGGSGTALELFRNRLGSVILAVSVSTGAVAAEYDYDYDSFGQRTLVQGTEEVRYGFTAREHDALTGLIHYRARAYDPLTGQFLQRDPIGFASGDLNLYAYVENDPYNWTDPSGLTQAGQLGVTGTRTMGSAVMRNIGMGVLGLATSIFSYMTSYTALDAVLNEADNDAVSAPPSATPIPNRDFWAGDRAHEYTHENAPNLVWHRRETPASLTLRLQVYGQTGLLTGGQNRILAGGTTTVNAYLGPLPPGVTGIEFQTPVPPTGLRGFGGGPGAYWSEDSPGVMDVSGGFVGIPVKITGINN